jgi:hypothetical protein
MQPPGSTSSTPFGWCLHCGHSTSDLDALAAHTRRCESPAGYIASFGACTWCGANPGAPCRTPNGHITTPHAVRPQVIA